MHSATRKDAKSKQKTIQEIFVCFSILLYSILWLGICINKYPDNTAEAGLDILIFSYLSSITACALFAISILLNDKGYQKVVPLFLFFSIIICIGGQFFFNHEYCNEYFALKYNMCYLSEFLSFLIYIVSCYYFMSMSLSRTKFKFATTDLQKIKTWFGATVRGYILLIINISMLIIIFIHAEMYSYFETLNGILNIFDVVWVGLVTVLGIISIVMRFKKCVPIIGHKWLLIILVCIAVIGFVIGTLTVWKYRISKWDGIARIGNVFIWCVVNLWVLLEFMAVDVNKMYDTLRFSDLSGANLNLNVNSAQSVQQK